MFALAKQKLAFLMAGINRCFSALAYPILLFRVGCRAVRKRGRRDATPAAAGQVRKAAGGCTGGPNTLLSDGSFSRLNSTSVLGWIGADSFR